MCPANVCPNKINIRDTVPRLLVMDVSQNDGRHDLIKITTFETLSG